MFNIWLLSIQHLELTLAGVGLAILIGVPIGYLITGNRWAAQLVVGFTDVMQTIPALALLALFMLWLGLGDTPLIMALLVYSLLPIVRNTYIGIIGIDGALIEAAKGMGMTRWQLLRMVQLPLALPVIMAGIRVATVTAIGIAAIGVLIGAGGLGAPIWRGMQQMNTAMILSGAVPAALLAVVSDAGLSKLERFIAPKGLSNTVAQNI
ncbi:ABC transporter permease [Syntrophothermus lipocalidus]|uniref:Binding-protein-dependent transport systems inner membrane component n=1 Tax=Syntrophothermus lipocalidus (strain DSM 12680 / TGB-C1) TaxID=643648 RepID=D7CL33_SYNLT|nr:ABC transporter permease [Syntrophothermus lipocalidus]ADI01418.1 binding-protein-dependent transport systems inner membrane component [Syntrophothermus lipocalidus DSM 12680]